MTSSLGISIGVFYVVMPVAGVLILLYSVLNIIGILKGELTPLPSEEAEGKEEA